jgi:hypothetical protein
MVCTAIQKRELEVLSKGQLASNRGCDYVQIVHRVDVSPDTALQPSLVCQDHKFLGLLSFGGRR